MTQTELDKLAEMKKVLRENCVCVDVGSYSCWVSTLDDCRPLFDEIERRGLWAEFVKNLLDVRNIRDNGKTCQRMKHKFHRGIYAALSGFFTPTDIVAAFQKTMEEK